MFEKFRISNLSTYLLTRHGYKSFLTQNKSQKNLDYIYSNTENKKACQIFVKKEQEI